jgi:DNA-directed RNA polymerase specialized sigma24 family protein
MEPLHNPPMAATSASPLFPTVSLPEVAAGEFHTTRWTQVVRAKAPSSEGREAQADLCAAYYSPVIVFLRREGREADTARELAHEFFEGLLEGGAIGGADREQGRFRSYLLGAVKHFLAHRREAARRLRRGAGVPLLPIEAEGALALAIADEENLPPDAAFDRQWALTVLARSLAMLKQECTAEGHAELFRHLQPWLTGDADHGDQAALAEALGMNLNSFKSAVRRMKRRFRAAVKAEVAATLVEGASVDEEMNALFAALRAG